MTTQLKRRVALTRPDRGPVTLRTRGVSTSANLDNQKTTGIRAVLGPDGCERSEPRARVRVPVGAAVHVPVGAGTYTPPEGGTKYPPDGRAQPRPRGAAPASDARTREARTDRDADQVDSLLELTAKLTHKQRQELLDNLALQAQMTAKAATNPDLDLWSVAVKEAMDRSVRGGGGDSYGVLLLKKLLGSSACWRPVEQFMQDSRLDQCPKVERIGIYYMLARLLVEDVMRLCRHSNIPMSAQMVAKRTGDLAGVFEQSFPGYLRAGLAPMVAKQMQSEVR